MSAFDRSAIFLYSVLACVLWSILVGGSLYWGQAKTRQAALDLALQEATDHIDKDLAFRRWVTFHGGVYVPVTEDTPPNPYLNVPARDVETTAGRKLTLMNPAYVLREMHQRFGAAFGVQGHITSLNPINPNNTADPWERKALKAFEGGAEQVSEAVEYDGKPVMRVMRAMRVEVGCLKCHAAQGYKEGDIRGGISSTAQLAPYLSRADSASRALAVSHSAIWLVGLAGIGYFNRRARRRMLEWETTEEQLRLAAQVFEGASEGVLITDAELRVIRINRAFSASFGYRQSSVLGGMFDVLRADRHEDGFYAALWADLRHTGHWQGEIWIRCQDGQVVPEWLSVTAVRDKGGRVLNFVGIFTDLSARIEAERKIRELNETLERRVRQRTVELEDANRELESFSYSVSHDLQAPLRAINGYANILSDEEAGRLSPEGRRLLERIGVNADKMGSLIDDILNFSRVGRSEMALSPVDMKALVEAVVSDLSADHPAASVTVGELPVVSGDPTMLRQVLANLLANALKFSSKRQLPKIEIGARYEGGVPVFFVRDNGVGFDMAAAAGRLFGVFQRLHSETDYPGTGAGLSIVKRIVERHGGRVWAEAEPDNGATFYFTLEAARWLPAGKD